MTALAYGDAGRRPARRHAQFADSGLPERVCHGWSSQSEPLAGKPTGDGEAIQVEHVADRSMAEVMQIVRGIHFHGGVDYFRRKGGRHSDWQARIDVA
jgi:hypothetical protein